MMKKQYLIYADESHRKGKYFSNFYEDFDKDKAYKLLDNLDIKADKAS